MSNGRNQLNREQHFRKLIGNGLTYTAISPSSVTTVDERRMGRSSGWISWALSRRTEEAHYMGYTCLQSAGRQDVRCHYGQQRLTTISIIVLAILKNIQRLINAGNDAEPNTRRMDQISADHVGYPRSRDTGRAPKLTPNRNNNTYFRPIWCHSDTFRRGFPRIGTFATQKLSSGSTSAQPNTPKAVQATRACGCSS